MSLYNNDYPTIDFRALHEYIMNSDILEHHEQVGNTSLYVIRGTSHINKRLVTIRVLADQQIPYLIASGVAIRFKFMHHFCDWLEENRNWKEGAYTDRKL